MQGPVQKDWLLQRIPGARLDELALHFGLSGSKPALQRLSSSRKVNTPALLEALSLDELAHFAEAFGVPADGDKATLTERLLDPDPASDPEEEAPSAAPPSAPRPEPETHPRQEAPSPGDRSAAQPGFTAPAMARSSAAGPEVDRPSWSGPKLDRPQGAEAAKDQGIWAQAYAQLIHELQSDPLRFHDLAPRIDRVADILVALSTVEPGPRAQVEVAPQPAEAELSSEPESSAAPAPPVDVEPEPGPGRASAAGANAAGADAAEGIAAEGDAGPPEISHEPDSASRAEDEAQAGPAEAVEAAPNEGDDAPPTQAPEPPTQGTSQDTIIAVWQTAHQLFELVEAEAQALASEATAFDAVLRLCTDERLDLAGATPDGVHREFVQFATAIARHAQEAQGRSEAGGMLIALAQQSRVYRPGFVHGLARDHTPNGASWYADAQAALRRFNAHFEAPDRRRARPINQPSPHR